MFGREWVPERDRVLSLQCYGYPLEQEHGLLLLVGHLSDSSSHFGDKLDCLLLLLLLVLLVLLIFICIIIICIIIIIIIYFFF